MVAFAILAAATKISSTLFTSFRSLGLQPFNSSTKCRPSACNSFAPFRCGLYREWPIYRLSHLPLRETTGKAHDTRKLCVNIAELFQLSINFFREPPSPPFQLPSLPFLDCLVLAFWAQREPVISLVAWPPSLSQTRVEPQQSVYPPALLSLTS